MKKIRLKDIARMAGVSETAASLVLNGKKNRVSEQKKEEIFAIAKEHSYTPSFYAQSLSKRSTNTIGLIIPDIRNPFFSALSRVIAHELSAKGYMLLISDSDDRTDLDCTLINNHISRDVDGLIICVSNESNANPNFYDEVLSKIRIPYVLVDRYFEQKSTNTVYYDNEYGGYIATRYMLDKGLTRIACITGNANAHVATQRYYGYLRALKEKGISFDSSIVYEGDFRYKSTLQYAKKIVEDNSIEGVFAGNDLMAYAVLSYRIKSSKRDLEVVGYDNLEQSDMFGIKMPSVNQDIIPLAHNAIEVLFKQIERKQDSDNIILIPELIV